MIPDPAPTASPPEPVRWDPPLAGGWLRHFRWGEWLPDPVTPLFDSWFLARSEARFIAEQAAACGIRPPPPMHVLVNGYYFHSPVGSGRATVMLQGLLRKPRFSLAFIRHNERPDRAEKICAAPHRRAWEQELLPRYRALVASGTARLSSATPAELVALIDEIADLSGALMWSLSMVGGFAWKAESSLARFFGKHLAGRTGGSHQTLLGGLTRPTPLPPHAVASLDWYHPTTAERPAASSAGDPGRFAALEEQRQEAEAACRKALADDRRLLSRWEMRLSIAQDYAVVREEQLASLTLAWPLLRKAVLALGAELTRGQLLAREIDVFFLDHRELQEALAAGSSAGASTDRTRPFDRAIFERRATWERNRHLSPPLVVGKLPGFLSAMITSTVAAMRTLRTEVNTPSIRGMPASPGRARGVARILLDPADGDRLLPGEVLVARATTPAWTPLFARAAAVVTDSGSVMAHASLIAREYGIPAVVATTDATRRLHDGDIITVDGGAGTVELAPPAISPR